MKILLVQTSFLGDTVLSTPVIAAIKKLHPLSELWMMTTPLSAGLVRMDPMLAGVITYDKKGADKGLSGFFRKLSEVRSHNFSIVYSLHKSYRTALLLKLAGVPKRVGFKQAALAFLYTKTVVRETEPHDVIRNLSLLANEKAFMESGQGLDGYFASDLRLFGEDSAGLFQKFPAISHGDKPLAVLVPGSAWKTKMWSWKGFRSTAEYLIGKGYRVVSIGSASEKEVCDKVCQGLDAMNLAGQTSIPQGLAAIKAASLVVCNDSMSLHMASAYKVPNVAVFCATSPKFGFGPWKNNALVVEKEGLPCKPCRRHGSNKCPTGTEACMNELPAENVISAIEKLCPIREN